MSEGVRYRFGKAKRKRDGATGAATGQAPPTALAMRLALAYYVERCIEDGTLASYADAARRLGITRARMTQVMDLLLLPVKEIERILDGQSRDPRTTNRPPPSAVGSSVRIAASTSVDFLHATPLRVDACRLFAQYRLQLECSLLILAAFRCQILKKHISPNENSPAGGRRKYGNEAAVVVQLGQ